MISVNTNYIKLKHQMQSVRQTKEVEKLSKI